MELVVALMVFQLGVLATAGMLLQAQRDLQRAEVTLRGVLEGDLLADSLARAGEVGSGRREYGWGEVVWYPANDPLAGLRIVSFSRLLGDTVFRSRVIAASHNEAQDREPSGEVEGGS